MTHLKDINRIAVALEKLVIILSCVYREQIITTSTKDVLGKDIVEHNKMILDTISDD